MDFAHTATSSGPNTEILLLGGGMLLLAVVFFFQKSASRGASLVLAVLGAVAITGAFALKDGDHGDVAVSIVSPEDGATVAAGEVELEVEVTGAEEGHLHVYVDGEDAGMQPGPGIEIELEEGEHEVEVEHVDVRHRPHDPPATDAVTVTAE
ncbi:MAG: hypothetical protein M3279_09930 [Actinomycetota bacterium]|nr:hypothetical protein [Actinomycetota bacterium]